MDYYYCFYYYYYRVLLLLLLLKIHSGPEKKTGHYIIGDNFVRCGPIFATFALLQRKLNFQ